MMRAASAGAIATVAVAGAGGLKGTAAGASGSEGTAAVWEARLASVEAAAMLVAAVESAAGAGGLPASGDTVGIAEPVDADTAVAGRNIEAAQEASAQKARVAGTRNRARST